MAYLTGSFSGSSVLGIYLYYSYTQNIDANTSTVTFTLKIKKNNSNASTWKQSTPWSIKVNGSTVKTGIDNFHTTSLTTGSYKTIGSYTKTFTHNSNGTLSITAGASFDLTGTTAGMGTVSTSTIKLQDIPKQSSITLSNTSFNIGSSLTGTIKSSSNTFYHKMQIKLDSTYTYEQKFSLGNYSISYNIPSTWKQSTVFSSSLSATAEIKLYTYSDSAYTKQVGTIYSTSVTLKIPTDSSSVSTYFTFNVSNPTIKSVDSNTYSAFLKDRTKAYFNSIKVTSNSGATIKYIRVTGSNGYDSGLLTYNTSTGTPVTTAILTTAGNITFTIYATDSRGIVGTYSKTFPINVMEYVPPKFKSVVTTRASLDENNKYVDSNEGSTIKCVIDFSYFSMNDTNRIKTLTISYYMDSINKIQKTFSFVNNTLIDNDTSKPYEGTKNGDSYYYTLYWDANIGTDTSIELTYTLEDLYTYVNYIDTLSSSFFIMDIAPNGRSIAFGKAAEDDEDSYGFEIAMPLKVTINNTQYNFNYDGLYFKENNSEVEEKIKFIREKHYTTGTTQDIILDSKSRYYSFKNILSSLSINANSSALSSPGTFNKISFATSKPFTFTNKNSNVLYSGLNCTNGTFGPKENSYYSINFEHVPNKIFGIVSGISIANDTSTGGGTTTDPTPEPPKVIGPDPFPRVNELIALAKTYYNKAKNNLYFEYGSKGKTVLSGGVVYNDTRCVGSSCPNNSYIGYTGPHYRSDNTSLRRYCDCSTFIGLILRGIPFSTSRYVSWSTYDSEFRPIDYEWAIDMRDTLTISSSDGGIRTAAEIGKMCNDRGWMLDDNLWSATDFSNLKAGDIIFWDRDSEDNARWEGISHVGICMGTEVVDTKEFEAKKYSTTNNTDVTILECTNGKAYSGSQFGIRFVKLKDSQPDKINHIARIQYKPYKTATVSNSTGTGANVRIGPSSSKDSSGNYIYESIGYLNNGTKIEIIDETNGRSSKWYKIKYNVTSGTYIGRSTGWIANSILSFN